MKHEEILLPRSVVCDRFTYFVSVTGFETSRHSEPLTIIRLLAKFQDEALDIPIALKSNPPVLVSPHSIMLPKSKDPVVRRVVLTSQKSFRITSVQNSARISLTYAEGEANKVHVFTITAGKQEMTKGSVESERVVVSVDHPAIREVTFVVYH